MQVLGVVVDLHAWDRIGAPTACVDTGFVLDAEARVVARMCAGE